MWFIGIWNNQWNAFICIKGIIICGTDAVTDNYGFVNVGPQYTFGSGWTISHCVTKICIFFIQLMFYHLAPSEIRFMIHFSLSRAAELFLMLTKNILHYICVLRNVFYFSYPEDVLKTLLGYFFHFFLSEPAEMFLMLIKTFYIKLACWAMFLVLLSWRRVGGIPRVIFHWPFPTSPTSDQHFNMADNEEDHRGEFVRLVCHNVNPSPW